MSQNSFKMAKALAAAITAVAAVPLSFAPSLIRPASARGGNDTVVFSMPYLESFQTTEHGEDEVYLIVAGKRSDGGSFQYRFPNGSDHWDLNDGEGDPPVRNQTLINFNNFDPGDSADLVVTVMEEDGGVAGGWISLGSAVVGAINKPAGAIISTIGQFLNFGDSDDVIGVFSVHIENINGDVFTSIKPIDRVYDISDPGKYWITFNVNMNGDGSKYKSQFSVTQR